VTVVLARVDDRLIHGQVTVGWCQQLQPDRLLLANNAIAADAWQCRVYASSVPPRIQVSILSVAEAVNLLKGSEAEQEKVMVLTGSLPEMVDLVRLGAPITRVNLGGIHFAPGKRELYPFVYLDDLDLRALCRLAELGVDVFAQQVPGGREHGLGVQAIRELGGPC